MTESIMRLKPNEMEQVSGGTFWPNLHLKEVYENGGIKIATHFRDPDEFWRNGQEIGHFGANQVLLFQKENHRAPVSLEEALNCRHKPSTSDVIADTIGP